MTRLPVSFRPHPDPDAMVHQTARKGEVLRLVMTVSYRADALRRFPSPRPGAPGGGLLPSPPPPATPPARPRPPRQPGDLSLRVPSRTPLHPANRLFEGDPVQ